MHNIGSIHIDTRQPRCISYLAIDPSFPSHYATRFVSRFMKAMPYPSTFQRLPSHIAEAIASWCYPIASPTIHVDPANCEMAKARWTELYNVSYLWRILALEYFFREITLNISANTGKVYYEFHRLPENIEIDTSYYDYAKSVYIAFTDFPKIPDTAGVHDFSSAWPKDLVFPLARHLDVSLAGFLYQKNSGHSITENERFYWVSQRIRSSMPKLCSVNVYDHGLEYILGGESFGQLWKADELLSAIFGKATEFRFAINSVCLTSSHSLVQNVPRLTRLVCTVANKNSTFHYVVGQSAPTLEYLFIENQCVDNLTALVFDYAGKPIVYPRLQKLYFFKDDSLGDDIKFRVDEPVRPFPVLRYLKWRSSYIFEDNALFRGNSGTLEYVDIEVGADLAEILQQFKVWSNGEYSKLCHVSVRGVSINSPIQPDPSVYIKYAAKLIAPATRFLSFHRYRLSDIGAISASPYLENIQVLRLTDTVATLRDLFELVRIFPGVTKLTFSPVDIDMIPASTQFKGIIDDLYTQYYPLSHRLRHWEYLIEFREEGGSVIHTILAFAIACPNFVSVFVPSIIRKDLELDLKEVVESGLYSEHVDKIQRLLRSV